MPDLFRHLILPAATALLQVASTAPVRAQGARSIAPARQIVQVEFFRNFNDPTGAWSKLDLLNPDGTTTRDWTIPAGQALVLTDYQVTGGQDTSMVATTGSIWVARKYVSSPYSLLTHAYIQINIPAHSDHTQSFAGNLSQTTGFLFTAATPPAIVPKVSASTWILSVQASGYLTSY